MFSCNVVSRWAQLVSFLNCLQDVKLSRIAIYRDEFRRMNCSLNWSFISCGELHCDSVKIKTTIDSRLFFSRQCESLDWSDCLVVLLLSATHFWKSGHVCLIRGYFSFSQCFRAGVFSSLSPLPLTRPISSSLREVSTWRFREQVVRSKKMPVLQANKPSDFLFLAFCNLEWPQKVILIGATAASVALLLDVAITGVLGLAHYW